MFEAKRESGSPLASKCPACGAGEPAAFWHAEGLPVFCNVLSDTEAEAQQIPRGDLSLAFCNRCGLIFNTAFDPHRLDYTGQYENSLHFSQVFEDYANSLANRLIETYKLRNTNVVEIACGSGNFLRALCQLGNNRGVGFDPSLRNRPADADSEGPVRFVRDHYGEQHAVRDVGLICCRHALEHIADPLAFLRMIRRNIADSDTVVYFEVPNALYTLRRMGIWDLIYEHCSYFVAPALRYVFEAAGFEVIRLAEEFDGQFLGLDARPGRKSDAPTADSAALGRVAEDVRMFSDGYRRKVAEWKQCLARLNEAGQRAVVWGAGSKGVTFLNVLKPGPQIGYVVDVNPHKRGKYVAGTAQRIIAPQSLTDIQPNTIIVMNEIYLDEIAAAVRALGLQAEILTA